MAALTATTITKSESSGGTRTCDEMSILIPTNAKMPASAGLSSRNFPSIDCSAKKSERRPRMAKMFEVKTMKGSNVTATTRCPELG